MLTLFIQWNRTPTPRIAPTNHTYCYHHPNDFHYRIIALKNVLSIIGIAFIVFLFIMFFIDEPFQAEDTQNRNLLTSAESDNYHIEFMTDVEGHIDYFQKVIQASKILKMVNDTNAVAGFRLEWKHNYLNNGYFVYGGDISDRGPGSIRVGTALVKFKDKYHDRVNFILGNRDLNTLRLMPELDMSYEDFISDEQQQRIRLYTSSVKRLPSDSNWEKWWNGSDTKPANKYELHDKNTTPDSEEEKVFRLKWILFKTMGASFDERKKELEIMYCDDHERFPHGIEDRHVFDSFVESINPNPAHPLKIGHGNFMFKYIKQSLLMYEKGNNLFMHAAIDSAMLQSGWMEQLQTDFHKSLEEYERNPKMWPDKSKLWHEKLYPGHEHNNYYSENIRAFFGDQFANKEAEAVRRYARQYFEENTQLDRVFFGHTPIGDTPIPIQIQCNNEVRQNAFMIAADTGRSGLEGQAEGRAGAYANFHITKQRVEISGVTANIDIHDEASKGTNYTIVLDGSETKIGTTNNDMYAIRKYVQPQSRFIMTMTYKGFSINYKYEKV